MHCRRRSAGGSCRDTSRLGANTRAWTITPPTRSAWTTRSSSWPSTPTTWPPSSTSSRGCARPRPRATRYATRRASRASRCRWSARWARSTASRCGPRRCALSRSALAQLRACDPVLAALIDATAKLPDRRADRPAADDHYGALVRTIVGQQLSVSAARAIYARLLERYGGKPPSPQQILAEEPEELRAAAGLSRAKVGFLRSLAEHAISGELELERLSELSDDEVIAELTAVKGIGLWSAHMFLMFHLERPDVLPVGDLGIRRAVERAYALGGLPDAAAMEKLAEPWRPHRTLACMYLWASLRNAPV